MTINPASFIKNNVADSCSLWNLLASELLFERALLEGCAFCCTGFVNYESAVAVRSKQSDGDSRLQKKFEDEKGKRRIQVYNLDVADLQDIDALQKRNNLGKGELSTIIFAKKTGQAAMTDDTKARILSAQVIGSLQTQTVPHLVSWLAYNSKLSSADGDKIVESQKLHGRQVHPHTSRGFALGVQCRDTVATSV